MPAADRQWCTVHGRREVADGVAVFAVCRDCGHAYPTALELARGYAMVVGRVATVDQVQFCPVCMHLMPSLSPLV